MFKRFVETCYHKLFAYASCGASICMNISIFLDIIV